MVITAPFHGAITGSNPVEDAFVMRRNYSFDTIKWINQEIDNLHNESVKVGELLLAENDYDLIKILDDQLKEIEKKLLKPLT